MKKTYLNSFCARFLTLLVLALMSTNLAWGAELVYSTGFENSEGFTETSTSYATSKDWGTSPNQWASVNGVVTSSSFFKLTGDQGFGMRKAKNEEAGSKEHSLAMKFNVEAYKIAFSAKSKSTTYWPSVKVLYSTDNGTSWVEMGSHTFEGTTNAENVSFEFTENKTAVRFKIQGVDAGKNTDGTSDLAIDDIKIYKKVAEGSHTISTIVDPENAGSITLGSVAVAEGETTTATANANEHFTFTGWSISGAGSSLSSTTENPTTITMGTEDATITATFAEDARYNVTFNANGGSGEMDAVSAYAGDYVLPECEFTKSGYKFIGWKANNTGEPIIAGGTYDITNAAVEFYAQWEETNEVTYDFKKIPLFSKWGNSYLEHAIQYEQADVIFKSANKNTSTILDQPVTKGGDVEIKAVDGRTISSVALTCKQWSSKAQIITLNYSSDGGKNYSPMTPAVTSENFSVETTTLPKNTNAVKFTFSSSDNQIGITSAVLEFSEPTINETSVTVSDKNFATASFRRNVVVPADNTVYLVSNVDENKVTLLGLDEGDICEAGLGLLVYQQGGGNVEFACTSETADWTKEFLKDETRLVGMPETGATLENDYGGTTNYILSVDTNDKFGFCTPKDNKFITSAGKAYLAVVGSSSAKSLEISFNDVTGIKTIDNSQLTIDNSKAYNLNGLRVNENYKGIIIVNGRKYINK